MVAVAVDLTAAACEVPAGSELTAGVTYCWHAQADDGAGNRGPWSRTHSFTVAWGRGWAGRPAVSG